MKKITTFLSASLFVLLAVGMFAFTNPNNKNLSGVSATAKPIYQPDTEYCFSASSDGISFYMIIEVADDGTLTGVVAGSDGTNTSSLSFSGYIDGMDMYLTDEDGDESVWTINDEGVVASDGTQFYEEAC